VVAKALLELAPDEIVVGRPFTQIQNNASDLAYLEHARCLVRELLHTHMLEEYRLVNPDIHALEMLGVDADFNAGYRIIIVNRAALLSHAPLVAVGFCGHKRHHLSPGLLDEMSELDAKLVEDMRAQSHMLSYCSVERTDGNWCNLVLIRTPQGIEQWRDGQRHAYATELLSPQYYQWIRLHNGLLPRGLASPHIEITRTKYYDFGDGNGDETWRAIRALA